MTQQMALPTLYNETLIALAYGKKVADVLKDLRSQGLPEPQAQQLINEAQREKEATFRKAGVQAIFKGVGLVALGIIITAFTYSLNLPIFLVAFGPVIGGATMFFKGMRQAITG